MALPWERGAWWRGPGLQTAHMAQARQLQRWPSLCTRLEAQGAAGAKDVEGRQPARLLPCQNRGPEVHYGLLLPCTLIWIMKEGPRMKLLCPHGSLRQGGMLGSPGQDFYKPQCEATALAFVLLLSLT